MSNEELKKKIVEIIINAIWKDAEADYDSTDETEACSIADALIAAGIVDKSDYASMKETAVRYKAEVSKAKGRAKEAELRAARAERALQKFAETITCEDCPFFSDCASSEKMEDLIHSSYCFAEYLRQAEKELAEENDGKKEV